MFIFASLATCTRSVFVQIPWSRKVLVAVGTQGYFCTFFPFLTVHFVSFVKVVVADAVNFNGCLFFLGSTTISAASEASNFDETPVPQVDLPFQNLFICAEDSLLVLPNPLCS